MSFFEKLKKCNRNINNCFFAFITSPSTLYFVVFVSFILSVKDIYQMFFTEEKIDYFKLFIDVPIILLFPLVVYIVLMDFIQKRKTKNKF